MKLRIDYLDGLRGVAILMVLGYHAYSRWLEILPYSSGQMNIIFNYGWLGVHLFFLISGFVIFLTLDKSSNFITFMFKRWLRLFPAMLVATIIVYVTSRFFSERPSGIPSIISILPGLTFIEPSWWSFVTGINIKPLEGVFWSLYVEFKFYVFAAVIYFFFGRKYLIPSLCLLYICSIALSSAVTYTDSEIIYVAYKLSETMTLNYFGWFAAGSLFYEFYRTNSKKFFWVGVMVVFICSIFVHNMEVRPAIAAFAIASVFASSLKTTWLQTLLRNKFLLFFGFISYPLYLIHENLMISMIIKIHNFLPGTPSVIYPFLPILILSCISYLIAKVYEPRIRKFFDILSAP